ncbi:MAG: CDP-alcohol phosphatidyltransferase family protein [Chloroflexota bacterium]|nr:CDP-alcohol phosphatidyltransferase family protein [Chloroflexota bacterium]
MISKLKPTVGRLLSEPFVRVLAKIGISPNALTVIGFFLNVFTGWMLATGHLFAGGFLVLFSGWFDMLDGAMARLLGKPTRFGALLDSAIDRLSEAALFLGLILFYADRGDTLEIALAFVAIIGSIMVSYTRARAEGLGLKCEVGLLARPERVALLALGLLLTEVSLTALLVILWIIAIGANLTALRRLHYCWQQSKDSDTV